MVVLEKNGEVRKKRNLELIGHWFKVDNTIYYILL
jgi:hypothetical protein